MKIILKIVAIVSIVGVAIAGIVKFLVHKELEET